MVRMTRRVTFSSGHRYWFSDRSPEENRALFGRWASPYNHGHNYVLDVTVAGRKNPVTGMIVNIKLIDDILRADIVAEFDQRSINDEVPSFRDRAPCLENILEYMSRVLSAEGALPSECRLVGLRLEESPTLWANWTAPKVGNRENQPMTLTRAYEFAASHRLHVSQLSDQENIELFGKCNNAAGHGHNYVLEVSVTGSPSPETGMITDLEALDEAVHREVVDRYDHRNFNEDIPEFAGLPPTTEVVTQEIFRRLEGKLPSKLVKVKLWETPRNAFEISAED
jgi:6-pyruvoyltetrahydropterin/6-carboxytetrahydropterin synthase